MVQKLNKITLRFVISATSKKRAKKLADQLFMMNGKIELIIILQGEDWDFKNTKLIY